MKQEREIKVVGSLAEELKEIEKFEKAPTVESEIRSITAACSMVLTIICC